MFKKKDSKYIKIYYCLTIISLLLFSCKSGTKQSELFEIIVDIDQFNSLKLSEITEDLTAIVLETTEKSLINTNNIKRIFILENEVIITELTKIHVFNKNGKFICSVGSKGQGPGEYVNIINVAIDEKSRRLFIINSFPSKIICYDLNGKFLKECRWKGYTPDVNYINDKLLCLVDRKDGDITNGTYSHSEIYRLDDDLQIIDSCSIRNMFLGKNGYSFRYYHINSILNYDMSAYIFYGNFFSVRDNSIKTIFADTLYRFEESHLIPELILRFKNDEIRKSIHLFNIYQSFRYVFSYYENNNDRRKYYFCYDKKTDKGYQMLYGYVDDINKIEKRVEIFPLITNTEMFYYWHTHMKLDDLVEPNPTLYIGKLKK